MSDLLTKLNYATTQLAKASDFAKGRFQTQVLDVAGRVILEKDGVNILYQRICELEQAGIFKGTDWGTPQHLQPQLVKGLLQQGIKRTVVLDCLSQLRMLAIINNDIQQPEFSAEQARDFVARVLSLNLNFVLGHVDETQRVRLGKLADAVSILYCSLLEHLGYDAILTQLVDEIWHILAQRPIDVMGVKKMVTQIAIVASQDNTNLRDAKLGVDRLVSALFGPSQGCQDDPGLVVYEERLFSMDNVALQLEAGGFSRAMHDVGLVSEYHAVFIRWLLKEDQAELLPLALGLSSTGMDALISYKQLIHTLIDEAIYPATAQATYGLALMLEKGILYDAPVAPSLWRQIQLQLHPDVESLLLNVCGTQLPARVYLLASTISLLGQPLGVTQGNHPTCQSARAISMWAHQDPDYLLHAIFQASHRNNLRMHFEGQPLDSCSLLQGLTGNQMLDSDPVSLVLVPHLDKLYIEMCRLCADRGEDPHKWVNPEFHGWYVGREFMIAVDLHTGKLINYDNFLQRFYRSYHPLYNGNIPLIHPQPAGIAITDSIANYIGWHAVTIIRIALDQDNVMRVYFYNPNSDSAQNWGNGVRVSIQGKGERFGEASLPFEQFLSRLYIYHDDELIYVDSDLPEAELKAVKDMAVNSWAKMKI